jgi:ribonuclease HII
MSFIPDMDLYEFDAQYKSRNVSLIAGIDEAGRGPLAGPVVAAAVILPEGFRVDSLRDSKRVLASQRERLFGIISQSALSVGIGLSTVEEIDQFNILEATRLAMVRACNALSIKPDLLIIDALRLEQLPIRQVAVIKGDNKSASVAAASIIAKVTRDRLMVELHKRYPQYGFERHKGYPTKAHREALRLHGPSEVHRKSFRWT